MPRGLPPGAHSAHPCTWNCGPWHWVSTVFCWDCPSQPFLACAQDLPCPTLTANPNILHTPWARDIGSSALTTSPSTCPLPGPCLAQGRLRWGACLGFSQESSHPPTLQFPSGNLHFPFQRPLSLIHCPSQLMPSRLLTVSELTIADVNCFCCGGENNTLLFYKTYLAGVTCPVLGKQYVRGNNGCRRETLQIYLQKRTTYFHFKLFNTFKS